MTPRIAARWLAFLCGLLLLVVCLAARADTPVSQFQSFRGRVNFTGTEGTLRSKDNNKACSLVNKKGVDAYLGGIPSGATIESAQLYWAGSGATADYTVTFDGVAVTASTKRQYIVNASRTANAYFSGAADVTDQVKKKGNGTYNFRDLAVDNGDPWCGVQGVVGGFALVVVYSNPGEPSRMLNLYEGFQSFQNTSLSIDLGNFNVPDPLPANVTGLIGHITWEGDQTLSQGGEDLLFNDVVMTDKYNPKGNQFNSSSNITGDTTSYGIDFDVYTLASPTIKPGQRSATTTYRSGQDLVLLSAEIVAMPYVANADLSLAMTRTGNLTVGSSTNYTLSVTNGGVDDEMGPVTVVDTLPAGLKLLSASGTGWTCSDVQNNGQTVVTCSQPGPLKSGAAMSPLVITVMPSAVANYTNTATVSGKTGDDNSANNTATNSSTSVDYGSSALVFTTRACTDGEKIVASASEQGCPRFIGPYVPAADTNTKIYITAVAGAQVASKMSDKDYLLSLELSFSCLPNSGVPISYAGRGDFDCKGTRQTVSAKLPGGQPSAVLENGALLAPFFYADVGRVSMTLRFNKAVMGTVDFISKPADIRFQRVFRADGTDDDARYGFVAAGEQFTMRVGAWMANNAFAPSFGKEPTELKGVLPDVTIALDLKVDRFLLNTKATPKVPVADDRMQQIAAYAFPADPKFAPNPNPGAPDVGAMDARVSWYEAGSFAATPYLVDYLGTGQIGGPPADIKKDPYSATRVVSGTRVIGRFYPDHFVTDVTSNIDCPPALNCPAASTDPAKPTFPVKGATYSRQPFTFTVKAYGPPRKEGDAIELSLFQNDSTRPVTLSAAKAPNESAAPAGLPAAGGLAAPVLPASAGPTDFPELKGTASYSTGNPYSPATAASRVAGDWGAPTLFYLRASMTEATGPGTTQRITSATAAGTWSPQYEAGLMAVAGRLSVPNVFGSDLLRLPVPLTAQYWNGTAWVTSATDDASQVAYGLKPSDKGCRKSFAQDAQGACASNPLALAGVVPIVLNRGKGTLLLQAPPRGTVGSVDYTLDNGDAKDWLPSTQARATFGLYRSPLIYLREVY